jgi:hypothetical protein
MMGCVLATATSALVASTAVRLERVVVLPGADRSSVVLELTGAPSQVSSRRINDSVVEIEAGPGVELAAPQALKAPASVRFVVGVTVREAATPAGPVVRARISLSTAAQAVVRSSGRRVYIDLSAPAAPVTPAGMPVAPTSVRAAAAPRPEATQTARPTPESAYKSAVRPTIEKLREIGPFLLSAAAAPNTPVATALAPTLSSLRATLASLQPPPAAQGSHTMLLSSVDQIANALAPSFNGDRVALVRQNVTTIEVVGEALVDGDLLR